MLAALITPLALLYLCILIGLIRVWWKHREVRRKLLWIIIPFGVIYLFSTPPAAYLTMHPLEKPYPQGDEVPADVGAIVVLAGSIRDSNVDKPRSEPGTDTVYRCLHASTLHRKAEHLPIVVSGGADGQGGPAYAHVMRDFLITQGIKASSLIVEDRSRNTHENAVECARILHERGIQRAVLVTDAAHMRRASGCFRKQGADVIPSACNHLQPQYHPKPSHILPSSQSVGIVNRAFHEWVGLLVYQVRGYL
jgi:uncharacterized SAM-binding protein YcdF (DUF218 family)